MPKSLKHTADVDVFDFGKAVTLILSQTKELNKTRNTLVDDISYLEARKKQEVTELEKVLAEKSEVLKLKSELTQKILTAKNDFMAEVSKKKEELAIREADLLAKEIAQTEDSAKLMQDITDRQNELAVRADENKKQWQSSIDTLNKRETSLIDRETVTETVKHSLEQEKADLAASLVDLTTKETALVDQKKDNESRKAELDNRESSIVTKETQVEKQRAALAALAADLEGQASLIQSERNKNKTEMESIRTMQKSLYDKKAELDNREIHLRDRETTALSH